jgi:hypothetical protein
MSLEISRVGAIPPHMEKACTPTANMHPIVGLAREILKECLPVLHYHYTAQKTNKHAQKAEDFAIEWFKKHLAKRDDKGELTPDAHRYIKGIQLNRFAQFAAHCSPDAEEEVAIIAAMLAVWLFFSDDIIEVSTDEEEMAYQFEQIRQICLDPKLAEASDNPSVRALGDIVTRMHAICTAELKPRFADLFYRYLKSNLWEINNVKNKRTPPSDEYGVMRYDTSATPLSFLMVQLDKKLDLPDSIINDPEVTELQRSGAFCCNDENEILSFFKELVQAVTERAKELTNRKDLNKDLSADEIQELKDLKELEELLKPDAFANKDEDMTAHLFKKVEEAVKKDYFVIHNLIHVYMKEGQTLEGAFRQTAEKLKREMKTFFDLREKIKTRTDFGDYLPKVKQLADGTVDWISAHHFWAVFAPRYNGSGFAAS